MKLRLSDGAEIKLWFQYSKVARGNMDKLESTAAYIQHEGIVHGASVVRDSRDAADRYQRERDAIGRRLALAKLLNRMDLPRAERTAIWAKVWANGMSKTERAPAKSKRNRKEAK